MNGAGMNGAGIAGAELSARGQLLLWLDLLLRLELLPQELLRLALELRSPLLGLLRRALTLCIGLRLCAGLLRMGLLHMGEAGLIEPGLSELGLRPLRLS